jgi:hypothetical protein
MLQRIHRSPRFHTYAGFGITAAGAVIAMLWTSPNEIAHSRIVATSSSPTPVISQQPRLAEQTVAATKLFDPQRLKVEEFPVRAARKHRTVLTDYCLNGSAKPRCREAFQSAIDQGNAFGSGESAENETVVEASRLPDRLPFAKYEDNWARRLKRVGKEGIPFARLPHGHDQEIVIGINRKGMLGFQMKAKAN